VTDARPYTKEQQLARGQRRHVRKKASPGTWQRIIDAKIGPCRVCLDPASNGRLHGKIQFHHVVPRDLGGDDVADNIVPLCHECHTYVTSRDQVSGMLLVSRLTDAEYAYAIDKAGEQVFERVYGIEYTR